MSDVGLLHPVVITTAGKLVAGERRLRAAALMGWLTVPAGRPSPKRGRPKAKKEGEL
jgi:hypothetical protein